jgi:hypothetical protein
MKPMVFLINIAPGLMRVSSMRLIGRENLSI